MKTKPHLSIVIPAYKEEKNIYSTIKAILAAEDSLGPDIEVIVVDDGSPDHTKKEAGRIKDSRVHVLSYGSNRGKGYALKYGTKYAKGEIITYTDAGGDFNPAQFDRCIKLMQIFEADLVIGSKRHPASKVNYPFSRRLYSNLYISLIRLLFGLKVTDTQAGLKFLKNEVAKKVIPLLTVEGYAFDLEMLVVANQMGYKRIFEAPVEMHFNNRNSSINTKTVWRMITDTFRIFYRARILNYYRKITKIKRP